MTTVEEEITITAPPDISEAVKKKLLTGVEEAGQVIVHCKLAAVECDTYARIWSSTYLVDKTSGNKSSLLHIEGISRFPYWTEIKMGARLFFTLVFSALPKDCKLFDFAEIIPDVGGFYVPDIGRNDADVYHVDLTSE